MVKILVIANPRAGVMAQRFRLFGSSPIAQMRRVMERCGVDLTVHLTCGPRDATQQARSAAERGAFDLVVAAGGDGTINEVANGLVGSSTALGVLPIGTENVLAKEMGIPLRIDRACEHMLATSPRPLDVGRVGDRYFVCFAGIGFDAHVVDGLGRARKERLGQLAYLMACLEQIGVYRGTDRSLRLRADGQLYEGDFWEVLVGNIKSYGGSFRPAPRASPVDGLLDLCVLPKTDYPSTLHQVAAILTGTHLKLPGVHYRQAREIVVESSTREKVQVDGEVVGTTPVTVSVVPAALNVCF